MGVTTRAAAVSAILGVVAAGMVLVVRYHEIRKSNAEAEKAVAEADAVKRPSPSDHPPTTQRPKADESGTGNVSNSGDISGLLKASKWRVRRTPANGDKSSVETIEFVGDRYLIQGQGVNAPRAYRCRFTQGGELRVEGKSVELVSADPDELVLSWGGEVTRYRRVTDSALWKVLGITLASALGLFVVWRYVNTSHSGNNSGCVTGAGCVSIVALPVAIYFFWSYIWHWVID